MTQTVRVIIKGRVQGVGFRNWLQNKAIDLGLNGWVRNRRDGSVEALAHGSEGEIEQLVRLCHTGPCWAHVSTVDAEPSSEGTISGLFEFRKTE